MLCGTWVGMCASASGNVDKHLSRLKIYAPVVKYQKILNVEDVLCISDEL